jgi:hypothetical protein
MGGSVVPANWVDRGLERWHAPAIDDAFPALRDPQAA